MKKLFFFSLFITILLFSAVSCKKLFPTLADDKINGSLTPGGDSDYLPPDELTDIFLKEVADSSYGFTDKKTSEIHYYNFSSDGRTITHVLVVGENKTEMEKYKYKETVGASQAYYYLIGEDGNQSDETRIILMENYYVMYMNNIALPNLRGYLGYDPEDSFYEDMEPEAVAYIEKLKGKSFTFRGLLTVHTYKFDAEGISIDYIVQMDGKEVIKKATYTLDSIVDDYNATFTANGTTSVKFIANENYDELYINDKTEANFKGYLKDTYTVPAMPNFKGKTYIKKDSDVTLFFKDNGERIRYWNGTSIFSGYSFETDNVATKDGNNFKAKFGGYNLEVSADATTIKFDGSTYLLQSIASPGDGGVASELKDLIKNQNFGARYEVSPDGETIHWNDGASIHYFYTFVKETGYSTPEGYKQAIYKKPGGNYYGVTYDEENKRIKMSSNFGYSSMDDVVYNGSWETSLPPAPEFKPFITNKTFVSVDGARYVFSEYGNDLKIGLSTFTFIEDMQKQGDYYRAKYGNLVVEFDEANNSVRISSKDSQWYTYKYNSPNQPASSFKQIAKGLKYRNGGDKYKFSPDGNMVSWNTDNYTYLEDRPDGSSTKRAVYTKGSEYFMTEISADGIKVRMGSGVLNPYTSTSYGGTWHNKIVDANLFLNAVKAKSYRKNGENITLYFATDGKEFMGWNGLSLMEKTSYGTEDADDVILLEENLYYSHKYSSRVTADSKTLKIEGNGLAWYIGDYKLIETTASTFKDNIKNDKYENVVQVSPSGDVIYWIETVLGVGYHYYYVFVEDAPNSPEGYKRAIYQKPGGNYYGVELIIGDGYKLISMGSANNNKANVVYSTTYYITGTPPDLKSKVANKTFIDPTTEARYVFNADGTVATWGVDLSFGSDEKPNGTYLTAKYGGTTFEYDAINNKVKSGKDSGKWYSYIYETPSAPASVFKTLVAGGEFRKDSNKYLFNADGSEVTWNNTKYVYIEDRSDGSGTKRAVYRNGTSFYMTEILDNGQKLRMNTGSSYNSTAFAGDYYLRYQTFKDRVAGKTFIRNNVKYEFDADSNLRQTVGSSVYTYRLDAQSADGFRGGYYWHEKGTFDLRYWGVKINEDLNVVEIGTTGWAGASDAANTTALFKNAADLVNP